MSHQTLKEVEPYHCVDGVAFRPVDTDSPTAVRGVVPDIGGDGHAVGASWYDLVQCTR